MLQCFDAILHAGQPVPHSLTYLPICEDILLAIGVLSSSNLVRENVLAAFDVTHLREDDLAAFDVRTSCMRTCPGSV